MKIAFSFFGLTFHNIGDIIKEINKNKKEN